MAVYKKTLSILTDVMDRTIRETISDLLHNQGYSTTEHFGYLNQIEEGRETIREHSIIFSDFHFFVQRIQKHSYEYWAYKVRKNDLYFILLIRTQNDEKYADLIDDFTKLFDNRLSVIRIKSDFRREKDRNVLLQEFQLVLEKNFHPDMLHRVSYHNHNRSFLVTFNDGTSGEISLYKLGISDIKTDLILEHPMISEQGNALILFTNEGDTFDIDAIVLKSFLSERVKKDIQQQAQLTADHLGAYIRTARKNRKVTQVQLSDITGIDQAILSKVETGKHIPRFDTIERIAIGLNLTIDNLLGFKAT